MQIANNKIVSIDYTLTGPTGEVLDTSKDRGPLTYLHGHGNIIPGLEAQLAGKTTNDAFKTTIPAAQAYGERDPGLIQAVPRDRFPVKDVTVGMQFLATTPQGHQRPVTVTAVDDKNITVDANHALAGMALTFDVTVKDIRDASPDELAHGHVHGPGGHQH